MKTIAPVFVVIFLTFSLTSSLCYHGKGMVSVLSNIKNLFLPFIKKLVKGQKTWATFKTRHVLGLTFICVQQCTYNFNQFVLIINWHNNTAMRVKCTAFCQICFFFFSLWSIVLLILVRYSCFEYLPVEECGSMYMYL